MRKWFKELNISVLEVLKLKVTKCTVQFFYNIILFYLAVFISGVHSIWQLKVTISKFILNISFNSKYVLALNDLKSFDKLEKISHSIKLSQMGTTLTFSWYYSIFLLSVSHSNIKFSKHLPWYISNYSAVW